MAHLRKAKVNLYCLVAIGSGLMLTPACRSDPTTAPSPTNTATLPRQQYLSAAIVNDQKKLSSMLGRGNAALKNVSDRNNLAPQMIPVIKHLQANIAELTTLSPASKAKFAGLQSLLPAILSDLGDNDSVAGIQSLVASPNPDEAIAGKSRQVLARWIETEKREDAQTPIVDDLEKLATANPKSDSVTAMTAGLSAEAASPDLQKRMVAMAAAMDNPTAESVRKQRDTIEAIRAKAASVLNNPLTIEGVTPQGKPYTTADLKGKVILVDFWATWCGPCREELPRVKQVYSNYHDKGLEIAGVSNDFDLNQLKTFIDKEQMPWPELFDAAAAANHQPHPVTVASGIMGIPVMYLIDKKGIVRSVTARDEMEDLIPKLLAEPN